ncbi:MAG: tRNA (adenosine(37)-N6)-threonylcarbamoyltransferase complex dimerization subunit type 1 TsaB [Candidatus Omnitrophica bacterium]|nr:tRNA (adenosine(37)-N6)-threonylcarbamoyltransferase complex dimerization subunit type 1 TsaB [Candidatus Omnitrophota bacterium]
MICLAVDTSSKFLCIVLMENERILRKFNQDKARAHGQLLIPEIQKILKTQKIRLQDLDCLAVNIGPGSFTGLRIGIAAVKGLSLALKIPIISLSSLDLIAYNCLKLEKTICSIIDAKRKQVYAAIFKNSGTSLKKQKKYFLGPIDDLLVNLKAAIVFSGDGVGLYKEQIMAHKNINPVFAQEKSWYTDPAVFAKLCYREYQNKKFKQAKDIVPMYLYPNTCTVRKKQKKSNAK